MFLTCITNGFIENIFLKIRYYTLELYRKNFSKNDLDVKALNSDEAT